MELRCPACNSVVYSRKSGLCGRCGAALPAEYKPSAREIAEEMERSERAERLASALTGRATRRGVGRDSPARAGALGDGDGGTNACPEPGQAFESEPASRLGNAQRGVHLWAGVVLVIILIASLVRLGRGKSGVSGIVFPFFVMGALAVWRGFGLWMAPKPFCSRCHENVTRCEVRHCYLCGSPAIKGQCDRCGVDESFWALDPFRLKGPIKYCPSCGVYMGSDFCRWRPDGGE
jgi:hypothetical protein